MFKDWFEKFEKAKQVYDQFDEEKKRLKLEQERRVRIEDLFAKFHEVGGVRMPFPSLFALKWLSDRYGDIDNINLADMGHLAAVVWILENQNAVDEIHTMSSKEIEAAIDRQAGEIPASLHLEYIAAVQDLFIVLKKNYLHHQRQLLEEAKTLLDSTSGNPGA